MKTSKGIFFLRRTIKDIIKPNRFGVNKDCIYQNKPFPYSLDYTTKGMVEAYDMTFDDDGIIMMPHYIDHIEKYDLAEEHYYSPVKIAHYALAAFNDYLKDGDNENFEIFERHINYLIVNKEYFNNNSDIVVWRTPSSNPKYDLGNNYVSAIVQGLVISALVRAYTVKQDETYLNAALKASNLLSISVEEGGLLATSKWGKAYEEYPCVPYSHVVNGFIFCLIGLKDLYMVSNNDKIEDLFNTGVETLIKMIDDWILPYWSKYDLLDITRGSSINLATRHYHYLHIDQLEIMWILTGNEIFKECSEKLLNQMNNPVNQIRIYTNKFKKLILKK